MSSAHFRPALRLVQVDRDSWSLGDRKGRLCLADAASCVCHLPFHARLGWGRGYVGMMGEGERIAPYLTSSQRLKGPSPHWR